MPRPKHMTEKEAQALDALLDDPALLRELAKKIPVGGTMPRKCHRAGQFKPGGGRYKTTTCGPKRRRAMSQEEAEDLRYFGAEKSAFESRFGGSDSKSTRKRKPRKKCRRPGEFKPGGGRYAKKTCLPRRKPKRKCHRAGQFKPGGGRYKTTPCRKKAR